MRLARALAATLALALNAAALGSGESGSLDPKATGGATGPLLGALNHVRIKHERACLSGITAAVNIYVDPNKNAPVVDPNCHAGSYNEFIYHFLSPEKPHLIDVQVYQPIGAGPICMAPLYGQYDSRYPGDGAHDFTGEVAVTCIAAFEVDTGRALAVAGKNGLGLGTLTDYVLELISAETKTQPDWKDKKLRGKVFWAVRLRQPEGPAREYLVDANTGAFLKARRYVDR